MRSIPRVFALFMFVVFVACTKAPARERVLHTRTFQVEVTGSGPPLVLIPGLGCSGKVWDTTVERYRARHTVHVLTLAGFGGTPAAAPSEHLVRDVRDDLLAYLDAEHVEKPVIVGHSLGGFVAYSVAAHAPGRVGAVVAVDGVPFLGDYFVPGATAESARPNAEKLRAHTAGLDAPAFAKETRAYLAAQIEDPASLDRVAKDSVRSSPPVVAEAMFELLTTDLRPETSRITAPVLHFVAGPADGKDAFVARVEAQLARIPSHEIVFVPVGHFVMLDAPSVFFANLDRVAR